MTFPKIADGVNRLCGSSSRKRVYLSSAKGFDFSVDKLENAIELLLNKGCLQNYVVGKFGIFYFTTKEFYNYLKSSIAIRIRMSQILKSI